MKPSVLLMCLATFGLVACSTAPRERAVSITTKPNFRSNSAGSDYYTFKVSGPKGERSIFWPKTAPRPDRMKEDSFYTIEFLEGERKPFGNDPDYAYSSPELVKVLDGEKVLYDASICSKHHVQMDRKLVKISYGLPFFTPEWKDLRESAPNDGTVLGGCSIDTNRLETRTWVCPTCKSIYDEGVARMDPAKR